MSTNSLYFATPSAAYYFRPTVAPWFSTLVVAMLITLAFNQSFMRSIWPLGGVSLAWPLISLLFLLNMLICQLFSIGTLQKGWLIGLLAISATGQYFMLQYGVVIDKDMLLNAIETDSHEIYGLLNPAMLPYFFSYVILPAVLLLWTKHSVVPQKRAVTGHIIAIAAILALIALLVLVQYQSFAAVFRQHRYLKHQATPFNMLNATIGAVRSKTAQHATPAFVHYAKDARLLPQQGKPRLVILVLGETVRADHLGLNGYQRNTTPKLAQRNIVNLGAIDACGTATAISVPCMFSYLNHDQYDETLAKNADNVLDVLQRAGVRVIWRDNNSGCKGMCDRVEQDQSFLSAAATACGPGDCPDTVLLNGLRQKLLTAKTANTPLFVVLHQQGNHGPEYYKRSLAGQKHFLPECKSNLLNQCPQQHIINAYDNAIVATDDMLDATIELLQSLSTEFDTAMLYVSDHGESLGENGVYLHGLPYWMAPEAQTRVPMFVWFSVGFNPLNTKDFQCLSERKRQAISHDMLFDSILGLMQVSSASIRAQQDIFTNCVVAANVS